MRQPKPHHYTAGRDIRGQVVIRKGASVLSEADNATPEHLHADTPAYVLSVGDTLARVSLFGTRVATVRVRDIRRD